MMQQRKIWILSVFLLALAACNRDPKVQAQRYLENGNKFFAKEKYKEASIMYRRALQKDLRFGEAYYRLALTDLKLQAYSDASRALQRAVELQPNNTDAKTKLADLFLVAAIQGGPQQAALIKEVQDLAGDEKGLLKQNPKSFDGHRIEGQLALLRRDPAAAIDHFEVANQIQPNQPDVVMSYFQALSATKRFPEAEKLAVDFLQKEKTYASMYDLLYLEYAGRTVSRMLKSCCEPRSKTIPRTAATWCSWPPTISWRRTVLRWIAPWRSSTMKRISPTDICRPGIFTFSGCASLKTRRSSTKPGRKISRNRRECTRSAG
jgi:tetratricopeptide (TPR) repeat protein